MTSHSRHPQKSVAGQYSALFACFSLFLHSQVLFKPTFNEIPSWHITEARELVGGASVSHTTTLTPLELYPEAAMIDPLVAT